MENNSYDYNRNPDEMAEALGNSELSGQLLAYLCGKFGIGVTCKWQNGDPVDANFFETDCVWGYQNKANEYYISEANKEMRDYELAQFKKKIQNRTGATMRDEVRQNDYERMT